MKTLLLTVTLLAFANSALATGHFVDVAGNLSNDRLATWYQMTDHLKDQFNEICPDAFCEGDYGNIQSLDYRCSIDSKTDIIGECVWTFAGSYEEISDNGKIKVTTKTWKCKTALARGTTYQNFIEALGQKDPLNAILPGTNNSLYNGLTDCFE